MDNRVTVDRFDELEARVLGMRDVLAQLLAFEALRSKNSDEMLISISETTAKRLFRISEDSEIANSVILLQEQIQTEVDWLVTAARLMIAAAKED